jgi:hypothetical protein
MIRTLQGLNFEVHSPSQYELIHHEATADRVFVWYTGSHNRDAGGAKWEVVYVHANGHQARRIFNSRDAAISLISSRARAIA